MNKKQLDNLSPAELKSYVERGIIHVDMTTATLPERIEDTPEYKKFTKLKGNKIHVAAASRKYDVPHPTISRWVKNGFIPVIGKEGAQKLLLDESYVAYCVHVYCQAPGRGRWAFNKNGTPRVEGVDLRNV
jgi:hypothetical protein